MEKAKQLIRDMQSSFEMDEELNPQDRDELKLKINDLLFVNLPSDISVGQMEALAFTIFDIIVNPKDYLTP